MLRPRTFLCVGAALLLFCAVGFTASGRPRASSAPAGHRATPLRVPALPRLGTIQMVDQDDVGDPFILPVRAARTVSAAAHGPAAEPAGGYVVFGTTDWQSNVPTAVSTNLTTWNPVPDALPVLPKWAAPSISMTWAPAVVQTAAGWVMYYSTEERASGLECLGRAISSAPAGPYTDRTSAPMLCQRSLGGSIDPSVVKGPGGTLLLVWKNNGNSVHLADSIWIEPLGPDGLTVRGPAHRLLGVDASWEHGIIEAPAMVAASAGGYWLFYSAGVWSSTRYATGLAYCAAVTGPCRETSAQPFLATTPSVISPGGLDTFTDQHGQLWAAFTSLVPMASPWHPGHVYYNRVLDIAPFLSH